MEFAEIKYSFFKNLVEHGYGSLAEVPKESLIGIPTRLLDKWWGQFKDAPAITTIPNNPRLVNRFTIGADPEFSLTQDGKPFPVMKIGLQTGLAFGMDMNGRLAELRPTPSRFALDVVASMLAELRWMALYIPNSLRYQWLSSPFDGQDGVGGHVHLARQRDEQGRLLDIDGLSFLYHSLTRIGVFSKELNDIRKSQTKYGQPNDIRPQKYGFEYRAFPTWMDSPWLAYLVLVLSKLAVYSPRLVRNIFDNTNRTPKALERAIVNMLAFFKNVDDDAWIAFNAFKKWGLPKQGGIDFRANWGILYPKQPALPAGRYYPSMIAGGDAERQAIFDYLVNKAAIKPDLPICNWEPRGIPDDYEWLMNVVQTYHKIGVGEISNELVCHKNCIVDITSMDHKDIITVYYNQYKCEEGAKALKSLLPNLVLSWKQLEGPGKLMLYLPTSLRTFDTIPKVKRVLTSGLFPLWKVGDVKADSFNSWVNEKKGQIERKLTGKELVI